MGLSIIGRIPTDIRIIRSLGCISRILNNDYQEINDSVFRSERVRFLELLRTSARELSLRYSNDVHRQCLSISYNEKAILFPFLKQRNIESLSSGWTFLAIVFAFYFSVIGLFSTGAICFGRGHRGQWKRIDSHVIKTFYLAFVKFFPSFRLLTLQAAQS